MADIISVAYVIENKVGLISVEAQRSDVGFTLGVPIWLGQSSSKQRTFNMQQKVFGGVIFFSGFH